ncbi:MAG TPA: pitrilysin family protein [Myxococcaceae bacterium]|jgi:zinc protease
MTALLASVLLAAAPPTLVQLETYTLPNGLTVILTPDRRLPTVGVNLWYHVGGANETSGRSGFAHLFEHLMFQGSKHRTGNEQDFAGLLEAAGSSDLNASTWNDRTNYFETLPANRLELALWLESERMAFLLDGLDQAKLDTQREVVRNERRQSVENTPYGKAEVRLVELLFPKPHPYFGAVIGSHEDLQAATLEDVKSFFRTFYVPANASLVIAGDFDQAKARALVEKYFGPIPRSPRPPAPVVNTLPITKQIRENLTDDVQLSRIFVGVIAPSAWTDEGVAYDVAQEILSAGKTGRLYRTLVFDRQVAQEVDMATDKSTFGSASEIRVTVKPGHLPAEAEALLDAELEKLARTPPTDAELRRAQRNIEARLYRGLERLNGNGSRADLINALQMWRGDPGFVNQLVARYRAVTPAQVQESARRYLAKDARVVLTVNPAPRTASAQ